MDSYLEILKLFVIVYKYDYVTTFDVTQSKKVLLKHIRITHTNSYATFELKVDNIHTLYLHLVYSPVLNYKRMK